MTSNLGSHEIKAVFETHENFDEAQKKANEMVLQLLKNTIRPEFLNRIDDIIMFSPFTTKEIQSIVRLQFKVLTKRLKQQALDITASDEAISALAQWGFNPEYGGRPVKRIIQKKVLNPLSKALLAGNIDNKKSILVDHFDGQIVLRNSEKAKE
jgi:ATP-dependent Clp protease ATP-binding subunit ClpB